MLLARCAVKAIDLFDSSTRRTACPSVQASFTRDLEMKLSAEKDMSSKVRGSELVSITNRNMRAVRPQLVDESLISTGNMSCFFVLSRLSRRNRSCWGLLPPVATERTLQEHVGRRWRKNSVLPCNRSNL